MKKVLCLALVLVFLLAVSISVSAEEAETDWATFDWNSVDWATFDMSQIGLGTEARPYHVKWLEEEAPFSNFFEFGRYADGPLGESFVYTASKRFIANPEGFLIALAKEDEAMQDRMIKYDLFGELALYDPNAMVAAIEGIQLNQETHPEAVELMLELIKVGEEKLNISIEIPKTGDPVLITVALALFSGVGLAVLLGNRKKALDIGNL